MITKNCAICNEKSLMKMITKNHMIMKGLSLKHVYCTEIIKNKEQEQRKEEKIRITFKTRLLKTSLLTYLFRLFSWKLLSPVLPIYQLDLSDIFELLTSVIAGAFPRIIWSLIFRTSN